MPVIAYREALNQALREEMKRNEGIFLMGEEVGAYDGAFKVSQGLLKEFGPQRVVDSPISELGFVGLGIGAAMMGLHPCIEVMTWNFAILAMDQIVNNAAKLRYMSGGQLSCPVVFRGPTGAGQQLSSQHSQMLEAQYAYFPGLKVVTPGTPRDAKGLLKSALRDPDPVIFMESELLYGVKAEVEEGELVIPIGKAEIKREGSDVTVICWHRMIYPVLEAAGLLAQQGITVEVVDMRTVRPLDTETVLGSVRKTHRAVIVEEAWHIASVGATLVDIIQREAFDELDAPVIRLNSKDVPMPYNKRLEAMYAPSAEDVVRAVKQVTYSE
jgi:pyruvate dehydrogenase E1 component beta subunit